ncbi:hypothetical protein JCGZ_00817 [Jatropha curcas]|uniref:Bifunctional inhibitor/plant lipid transfer protein/seed storage helical domain-containing protein n=1 Tax=Jatropha curcas TaxID=180498 RepID=A0A067L3H7_JATCU|nr:2S albumin [Jatropha curcas]KDP39060.1 hypothetical protein JCGZ_00817 [Jatropha curcas]
MAKLITSTALICILLVIIANAVSGHMTTTTTTTTVEMDDAYEVREMCKREAERTNLSSCERYIRQSRTRSEALLAMKGIENRHHNVPRQCCDQARKLRAICRCESILYLPEKQGFVGSEEYEEAESRSYNIIDVCFGSACPR